MFHVAKIRKAAIMVLHKELYQVTHKLATMRTIEIIPSTESSTWNNEEIEKSEALLHKAQNICKNLELEQDQNKTDNNPMEPDLEKLSEILESIQKKVMPLIQTKDMLQTKLNETERSINEIENFSKLDLDFKSINNVSFLYFKYGSVPATRLAELREAAGERSLIFPAQDSPNEKGHIPLLAVSSKKGRFALETILNQTNFQEIEVPEIVQGVPSKMLEQMEQEKRLLLKEIKQNKYSLKKFADSKKEIIVETIKKLSSYLKILQVMQQFVHTEYTATIHCWIPASNIKKIEKALNKITASKIVIESKDPLKMKKEERGRIPILLSNNRLVKPFEFLISNYGYPEYGEIEPTPIVAIGFIVMFGIMFGDVGQGAILLLTGLLLSLKKKLKENIRLAGMLIAYAGCSSIFFGFVYGSIFCNPHIIKPLWQEPLHNINAIMSLLGATIAFGIIWINVGLLLNLINKIRSRNFKEAVFEKTGLLGIAFYWGSLYSLISALYFKTGISSTTILLLVGTPLLLLFLREPLYNLIVRKPLFEHGVFTFIMEGLVEIIDTLAYFLGNTVSFVRVGAFALAHSGLSLAFMELAGIVGHGAAGIIVLAFGNLLIIALEGMVVSIQTLRLEYYEFFSKFYSGGGIPFKPFSLSE